MIGSLILEECIRNKKDEKILSTYIVFLDAETAFDVLSHTNIMHKLSPTGIEDIHWDLTNSLHSNAETVIKNRTECFLSFEVLQGVMLGALLSTDMY